MKKNSTEPFSEHTHKCDLNFLPSLSGVIDYTIDM